MAVNAGGKGSAVPTRRKNVRKQSVVMCSWMEGKEMRADALLIAHWQGKGGLVSLKLVGVGLARLMLQPG